MLNTVTFEGQITVFEHPPRHTVILAEISQVNPDMLGKHRLRATKCANDQRHWSSWGEYMLDTVAFEGQITVLGHSPRHTRIFAGI